MVQNFPYLNNDAFRKICDHCFWHDGAPVENAAFRSGDIVFCKIDEVWRIFRALRRTRKRIVLVTGEGFKPVTPDLYRQKPPHVAHWFGTNMFAIAEDVTPLPLGVGNAAGGSALRPEEFPVDPPRPENRSLLLYANFTSATNSAVREPLSRWVAGKSWITSTGHTGDGGKAAYLEALRRHHFVLCPPGAGEDTHRMWESLYCGAIPVVRCSPVMRTFHDLPVLFVDEFRNLTEKFLREILAHWPHEKFSRLKLRHDYWRDRLEHARGSARCRGRVTIPEWVAAWAREIKRVAAR
jgi:hypothetical protein